MELTGKNGILRPGVVWFGEQLNRGMMKDIENWVSESVDLCIIIGQPQGIATPPLFCPYAHTRVADWCV